MLIVFLSSVLAILFSAHYLVYVSLIRFLGITNPIVKHILLYVLLFLSLSFVTSFSLVRLQRNFFTEAFYVFSALWIGLLIHVIIALVFIWLVFGVARLTGWYTLNMRTTGIVFLSLAALVSLASNWNAFHPHVGYREVKLKNLPTQWKNKTIVQLSDVHLGTFHRTGFLRRIVEEVNAVHPTLILITGDLFDGMGGDLPSFIEPLNALTASEGVFFVTGNHESYLGLTKPLSIIRKTHVTILDNEVVNLNGLQIVGLSFPDFFKPWNGESVFEAGGKFDPQKPTILMYHTPTNIKRSNRNRKERHFELYWVPDTDFSFAKEHGIDLQLSGHTHRGQLFPFGYLTKLIYKGYDYGLHRDGNFTLYTTSGLGTWGPPMRTMGTPEIVVIRLK